MRLYPPQLGPKSYLCLAGIAAASAVLLTWSFFEQDDNGLLLRVLHFVAPGFRGTAQVVVSGALLLAVLLILGYSCSYFLLEANDHNIRSLLGYGSECRGTDGMARPFSRIHALLQRGEAQTALHELDELRAAHPVLEHAAQALACRILRDDLRRPQEALNRALSHLGVHHRLVDDDAGTLHLAVDLILENQQRERALALLDDMIPRFPEGALRRELQRRRMHLQ